jgi:amino acid permease
MLGVICSFYLVMCMLFMFLVDRSIVESMPANFKAATYFKFSYRGLINAVPFVIFSFMYQPNIPIVYRELHNKNYRRMEKVIVRGSGSVVVLYIIASTFGYLLVVKNDELFGQLIQNRTVLEVNFDNWAFKIALIGLLFAIFAAAPM